MLAAGKKYSFWTKIYFPELGGVGQVEDRWQAIVHAWERWQKYDRIDIWWWKWDIALMRALSFGKRVMVAYVCPASKKMKVWFDWNKFSILDNFFKKTLWGIWLYVWRKDEWVTTLQVYLKELGFFNYKVTGYFWNITKRAVGKFQSYYHIKTNGWWWYFWPSTRDKLKKVLKEKWLLKYDTKKKQIKQEPVLVVNPNPLLEQTKKELAILKRWLGRGYHTYEVKILQKYLKKLWYYDWLVDWYYSQNTVDAVAKFQLDNWIISSTDSYVAGWFWPSTRELFKKIVLNKMRG